MLKYSYRSRSRGFTLIELLVVIAIIAILAAILFPVFAQARESARAISCMSNVREMGLGMQQYTQDYDETMPFAFGCTGMLTWQGTINPYIKVGKDSDLSALQVKDKFWNCPDDESATVKMSYGVNADVTGVCNGATWETAGVRMEGASLASIQRPSDLVFCGDGSHSWHPENNDFEESAVDWIRVQNGSGVGDGDIAGQQSDPAVQQQFENALKNDYTDAHIGWQDASPTWTNKGPAYRHHRNGEDSGFANLVYCDGHAKAARFGSLHVGNFFPGMTQDLPQP